MYLQQRKSLAITSNSSSLIYRKNYIFKERILLDDNSASMTMPESVPEITRGIWAGNRFEVVLVDNVEVFVEQEGWEDGSEELKKHFEAERTFREASLIDTKIYSFPGYILRNLSKVYVRGSNPPCIIKGHCTFGQMLFARICWSSDESVNMAMPDGVPEITRGLLAGDRFDIVSLDDAEEFVQGDGWEDVTEQLKRDVEAIFAENNMFESEVPMWLNGGLSWDGR
ncbi:hypothetical protein BDQ17DRAFT_1322003 [Cyathus striatus]|nr:hypothetical protein BDQ17DRAFT_1322003 [Cyathus striatus]